MPLPAAATGGENDAPETVSVKAALPAITVLVLSALSDGAGAFTVKVNKLDGNNWASPLLWLISVIVCRPCAVSSE